jgi:hypothetical protein
MKYSGDTGANPRPPVKRDVPVRVPMVMISPWSAVPVSTPYCGMVSGNMFVI